MTQTALPINPQALPVARGEAAMHAPVGQDLPADRFAAMLAACLDPTCPPGFAEDAPVPGDASAQLLDLPPASEAATAELTDLLDSVADLLDTGAMQELAALPTSPLASVAATPGGTHTDRSQAGLPVQMVTSPAVLPAPPNTESRRSTPAATTGPDSAALLPGSATDPAKPSAAQPPVPAGQTVPELATSVESAPVAAAAASARELSDRQTPLGAETGARLPDAPTHVASAQHPSGSRAELAGRIEAAVGSPRWGSELAERVTWLVGRGDGRAELVLNPPQFGRLEISVSVKGDEASAVFVSGNAQVRESIEQALPRLREILAEAGVQLGQTSVSAESPRRDPTTNAGRSGIGRSPADADAVGPAGEIARASYALVDTFV
jgi:flagellar hook-length control protein FliK